MSKFEANPSRGMKIWAAVVAVTAGAGLISAHHASGRLIAAGMLLGAWQMAFLPGLPLNLTPGQIYQKVRQGWRMSPLARILNLAMFALLVFGAYLQSHGR